MYNIRELQGNLNYLNFPCGKVDGILGRKTKNALKNFQKSFEITQIGILDTATNNKMHDLICDIQKKIGCKIIDGVARKRNNNKN